jgi:hypothetical protein
MKRMKKKFAALLIPLLLIPMTSLAYAHFTDEVVKKYKIHVGSVFLNVTGFHVDYVKMPDVDNDDVTFGDELNITIYESDDCRWYIEIEADPITGGFVLNTTMWMHNGGKLPFTLDWDVKWDGPYPEDPCYDVPPAKDLTTLPMPPWSFEIKVYRWHMNPTTGEYERTGPLDPTQVDYKPCDYIEVKQHVNFKQPAPGETYQKDWQCKWIKIWVTFSAEDVTRTDSSWTWGELGVPD